jgi:hypothetical protein
MKRYEETFSALMSLITFSLAPSPYRFDSVLPPFFPPLPIVCQLTKPKNTTKREKFMDLCDGDSAVGVGGRRQKPWEIGYYSRSDSDKRVVRGVY